VRRVLALAVAVGMVLAVAGASCGVAAAAPHRQVPAVGRGGAGSGMTLAQAPAGLQAAVRRALGGPAAPAGPVVQQAKLISGTTGDDFGDSVAISGSTAVVGADTTGPPTGGPGAAYVFTHTPGGPWQQQGPALTDPNGAAFDNFGFSVAIWGSVAVSGPTTAVGAPDKTPAGAAYVFQGA
jgi:hypothetical protein